jgi:GntR family transcriptional regulator
MPVNQMDPTPLYEQLAATLRAQMSDGALSSGALLPSESYLQQEHGVSRSTVRAALRVLRDEGLVITITARGTFVK